MTRALLDTNVILDVLLARSPWDQDAKAVLNQALGLPISDFEDAVQVASAVSAGVEAIITRNPKDYTNSSLPVFSPADFLSSLPK